MTHLILFGPPGAGKGTQSQRIIQHFDLLHLATGDLLRSEIMNQTNLGIKAKAYMDEGELVPDDLVIDIIDKKLLDLGNKKGVVFDGFPRTIPQAEALDALLHSRSETISGLVELKVPHDELIKRLNSRGLTSGRADDASQSTIEHRLDIYHQKTSPIIAYYDKKNKHLPVQGVGKIDEISDRLIKAIESVLK